MTDKTVVTSEVAPPGGHFPEPRPVRTTVGAALLDGLKVEITVIARRGGQG
jgi:enamine deaminase RidA (YjgF/YER057c/UK114 family)